MFTGIIEEVGRVVELQKKASSGRLTISCSAVLDDATPGASIAVNGTCLTAVELSAAGFTADLSPETLKRSNLGSLQPGSLVNLERPLRATGRLDGHFVLGHVDGTAEVISLAPLGDDNWWLRIQVPTELARYLVEKGSLAVDGISLTIAETEGGLAGFTIIPHTFEHTALRTLRPGMQVNLEADILAKHLEKLISGNH